LLALTIALCATAALGAGDPPGNGPRTACKDDVEKLCPGLAPGGGRIAACLKQNEAQVSSTCKAALANARQKKMPPPQGSN